ncbi:MAG: CHAT domain-containing protein, partial [Cyanobacteria bacterium P01_H01_bin.15]
VKIDESFAELKLALGIALFQEGEQEEGLRWGMDALRQDQQYGNLAVLAQNLWGPKLLTAAENFLKQEQAQSILPQSERPIQEFIEGDLDSKSPTDENGVYYSSYTINGEAGQWLLVDLTSQDFNPALVIFDQDKEVIIAPDDAGEDNSVRRGVELPTSGNYEIFIRSHEVGETGTYQLSWQITTVNVVLAEADSLNQEVLALIDQGNLAAAIPLAKKALDLQQRVHDGAHPDIASSLNILGFLYQAQGWNIEAEQYFLNAIEVFRQIYKDQDHPDVAQALNNLGFVNTSLGRYKTAEQYYQNALAMRRRIYNNQDNLDVAISLNNLGILYESNGRYGEAETYFLESLAMLRRIHQDQDHPSVAINLNNLGGLYQAQGRDGEAEPYLQNALAMLRRIYQDQDYPDVAQSLNNLGTLYESQGRYDEAEPYFLSALAMFQRIFNNQDHPYIATTLNNLGGSSESQGKYEEAETYFQEAVHMLKRIHEDQDHPHSALSINNLGTLYESQGRYAEAEPHLLDALAMLKRIHQDQDHPYIALNLNNLGSLYQSLGRVAEAESYFLEALEMFQRIHESKDHPFLALNLNNLGLFYQVQDNYSAALTFYSQAADMEESLIAANLLVGSERQKQQYLDLFRDRTNNYISFHLQAVPHNDRASRLALTTLLRRKGRVLDAMGKAMQTLRDNLDPVGKELFSTLTDKQAQRAALSFRSLASQEPFGQQLDDKRTRLDKEIQRLESQLSARSSEFHQITEPAMIAAVQAAIPYNAALVEFVQYRPFDPDGPNGEQFGKPRYAVYVLNSAGDVRFRDLGEAAHIDELIQRFRRGINEGDLNHNLQPAVSDGETIRSTARELDQRLMVPVREIIGTASHLLLAPDSSLNLLPFAALVDETGQYLVQKYRLTYLTSGRDLLRVRYRERSPQAPLALTNPNYGQTGILSQAAKDSNLRGDINDSRRSTELNNLTFGPLPGTEAEGKALAQMLPDLTLLTEIEASEDSLKQYPRPEILHIATHGFFLKPEQVTTTFRSQQQLGPPRENPLLRSGLALAGFNLRTSEGEDGVLTALEVTGLNLRGTRLVVLSACSTGLGDIATGEGVYGLRRAFTLAGAESQLMSLWDVSDEGTQELMVDYYRRLQQGEGRGEALRQVQLAMLRNPERAHPFFWAAFIPIGDWSPLE